MRLDKETRLAVAAAVKQAAAETYETYQERWVSGSQLTAEIPFLNKEFLKKWGSLIPRERISVVDAEGVTHKTGFIYPINKIKRLIAEGKLRRLNVGGMV